MGDALHMELREHRSSFIVYFILRILVIVMMILQLMNQNYENVFLCVLTLVLLVGTQFYSGDLPGGASHPSGDYHTDIYFCRGDFWGRSANSI